MVVSEPSKDEFFHAVSHDGSHAVWHIIDNYMAARALCGFRPRNDWFEVRQLGKWGRPCPRCWTIYDQTKE